MPPALHRNKLWILALGALLLLAPLQLGTGMLAYGQGSTPYLRVVRAIHTAPLGVAHPVGLTYAPDTKRFLLRPAAGDAVGRALESRQLLKPVHAAMVAARSHEGVQVPMRPPSMRVIAIVAERGRWPAP